MTRSDSPLPVFDGHNDVLSKLYVTHPLDPAAAFINGYEAAIDLPKSRAGGFAGGFFAVYIPPLDVDHDARTAAMMKCETFVVPARLARNHSHDDDRHSHDDDDHGHRDAG